MKENRMPNTILDPKRVVDGIDTEYDIDLNPLDDDMTSIFMADREEVHREDMSEFDLEFEQWERDQEPKKPEATVGRIAEGALQELKHAPSNFAASARSFVESELNRTTDPTSKANFEKLRDRIQEFEESETFKMSPEFEGQSSGFFEDVARGITGSLPEMTMFITPATMPIGMAGVFSHIQGSSYRKTTKELREKFPNMSEKELQRRAFHSANVSAAIQTPLEAVGNLFKLKSILGPRGFTKRLVQLAESALGEGFTEFIQQFPDEFATMWALNPDLSSPELLEHIYDNLYDITKRASYAGAVGAAAGTTTTTAGITLGETINVISKKQKEINEKRAAALKEKLDAGEDVNEEDLVDIPMEEVAPEDIEGEPLEEPVEIIEVDMSVPENTILAEAVSDLPDTTLSYGGVQAGTDVIPDQHLFTIVEGPGKGDTLNVPIDNLTPEAVRDVVDDKLYEIEDAKIKSESISDKLRKDFTYVEEQRKKLETWVYMDKRLRDETAPPVWETWLEDFRSIDDIDTMKQKRMDEINTRRGEAPQTVEVLKQYAEYLGLSEEDVANRMSGKASNAVEMLAELEIVQEHELAVAKATMDVISKGADATKADVAYMIGQLIKHRSLLDKFNDATSEAGRSLGILSQVETAGELTDDVLENAMSFLKRRGEDPLVLAEIVMIAQKNNRLNQVLKSIGKMGITDIGLELWVNGLLSNPTTHIVNALSNSLVMGWMIPERFMGALSSKLRRGFLKSPVGQAMFGDQTGFLDIQNPDGAQAIDPATLEIQFGEALSLTFGLASGIFYDIPILLGTTIGETTKPIFEGDTTAIMEAIKGAHEKIMSPAIARKGTKLEGHKSFKGMSAKGFNEAFNTNISGWLEVAVNYIGAVMRLPGSALILSDKVFRETLGFRMELSALAYREASAERLEGWDLVNRMTEIIQNPQEAAPQLLKAVEEQAAYQTFTNRLDNAGQHIEKAINYNNFLKLIVPFFRTPVNIFKFGFQRTPFAMFSKTFWGDVQAGGARADLAIAKVCVGSMFAGAFAVAAGSGLITGGGPKDKDLRNLKRNQGWQPYSFKFEDTYYSFSRLEPLGMIAGMAADAVDIMGEAGPEDADQIAIALTYAFSNNVTSKTWLKGVSEFLNVVNQPERYTEQYVYKLLATTVPMSSLQAQLTRGEDPTLKDIKIRSRNDEFAKDAFYKLLDSVRARTPFFSGGINPRVNIWGEEIVLGGGLGPDMISPIYTSKKKSSPIDAEMYRLGVEDNRHFSMPRKTISIRGVDVELTGEEYKLYVKTMNQENTIEKGRTLKESLNAAVREFDNEAYPDEVRFNIISNYFKAARTQAAEVLYNTTPEIREYVEQGHKKRIEELEYNKEQ